jgi:hypothetical protein
MELIDPYELIRYKLINWYPELKSLNIYSFMDYRKISPDNFPELIFQITNKKQKFRLTNMNTNKSNKYWLQEILKLINLKTLGYIISVNEYSRNDTNLYKCISIDCYPYQQHLKNSVINVQRKFREKREIEARPPTMEYPLGGKKYRELVEKYRLNPLNFGN